MEWRTILCRRHFAKRSQQIRPHGSSKGPGLGGSIRNGIRMAWRSPAQCMWREACRRPRKSQKYQGILHKVGVTSQDVRRRIADAKNDPTFLLAPVEIVATYELHNLERMKVEDLLHRFFDAARPQGLVITDRFGKAVHPREWFYVLPEHVSQAVQLIRERRLHEFRFDPQSQSIVQISGITVE